MNYIGIINQHHVGEPDAFDKDKKIISEADAKKVLNYINSNGEKFAVSMQVINSLITNEILGSVSFYTDGIWIWPSYFSHYLEHRLIDVPDDFVSYLDHVDEKKESYSCRSISEAINYHKVNFDSYLISAKSD